MSSSDRRQFLRLTAAAALVATVAGCGFTPAYAPGAGGTALLNRVRMDDPKTPDEFALTRRLAERLGPTKAPAYRLAYTVETRAIGQAITTDNATTRYSLSGSASYSLRDAQTDALLLNGEVSSFTSWSASGSTVSTRTAEDDAHVRLMRILADQIVTRLLATSSSLPR